MNTNTQENYNTIVAAVKFHVHNEALCNGLLALLNDNANAVQSAPASSRNHHAYPGGLLQHYTEVLKYSITELGDTIRDVPLTLTKEQIDQMYEDLVVSLVLHDLHKIGDPLGRKFYEPNMISASRKKNDTSLVQSTKKPYVRNAQCYDFRTATELGTLGRSLAECLFRNRDAIHEGELSLQFVQAKAPALYDLLNDHVKFCVRHHDGAYSSGASYEMAGKETPVQQALHNADMRSSRQGRWLTPAAVEEAD
jgi:Putative helicase